VRIGYSFWGFLGPGVVDTPDGGRSHRRTLVDGLRGLGHRVVFLQRDRDLHEVELDLREHYRWDPGLPELEALLLEWRWPIPGRSVGTACGAPGHTCDLHRQDELLAHYTLGRHTPTVLWDKDRRLSADDPLRWLGNVAVCEPALHPTPGATSLLFPVADAALDQADPVALAGVQRPLPLIYIGNQYDRDQAFDTFFAPAAVRFPHRVAGKWPRTARWPHVRFTGRCPFPEVERLYQSALTTVLLLPDRYAIVGQMTQRLFEAVLAGCLPITPTTIVDAARFTPPILHASSCDQVMTRIEQLLGLVGTRAHADLLSECLRGLDSFRLSRQLATFSRLLERLTTATARRAEMPGRPACPQGRR
jgi:hypothetical protein